MGSQILEYGASGFRPIGRMDTGEVAIGPNEITCRASFDFLGSFVGHFPGVSMPGDNPKSRVGHCVAERKYKLVSSGTERTDSPSAACCCMKAMAA